jgi:hypothetical protein
MTSARWTMTGANTRTFDLSGLLPTRQASDHGAGMFRAEGGKSPKSGTRQTPRACCASSARAAAAHHTASRQAQRRPLPATAPHRPPIASVSGLAGAIQSTEEPVLCDLGDTPGRADRRECARLL